MGPGPRSARTWPQFFRDYRRGNYWKVTSWKCVGAGAGQAYRNTWPAFNCNLRIHDLNLNTLEYEMYRLAARFVVGGRNGGYWTNIHELTTSVPA